MSETETLKDEYQPRRKKKKKPFLLLERDVSEQCNDGSVAEARRTQLVRAHQSTKSKINAIEITKPKSALPRAIHVVSNIDQSKADKIVDAS